MSQNLNQIAILAAAMRDAQRAYFRRRTPDLLVAAKQAEAALDKALAALGQVEEPERLRAYAKDQGGRHNIDNTREEAAAEIERLREALRQIDAAIRHGLDHFKGAVSEKIVREVALITREALKERGDE